MCVRVCVMLITGTQMLVYVLGSIKYKPWFWIVRVSEISMHFSPPPFLPNIIPDDGQYTVVFTVTIIWIMYINFGGTNRVLLMSRYVINLIASRLQDVDKLLFLSHIHLYVSSEGVCKCWLAFRIRPVSFLEQSVAWIYFLEFKVLGFVVRRYNLQISETP